MPVYDTIIVGLGAAGCTAANVLCKAGRKVLALEAQNRIGGRVHTVPVADGVVELGAEWIHGTENSRTYDMAIKNQVPLLSQPLTFDVYHSNGLKGDQALINELVEFCLSVVEESPSTPQPLGLHITNRLQDYLTKNHPTIAKDQDFVTEFLHFMDLLIDNYESSNSWNDVTTESKYDELDGDQHMSWHTGGYKTLFEILLNTYNKGPGFPNLDIKLNTEVILIRWPQTPAENVHVTCKDGSEYTARTIIVTVSVGVLKERHSSLFIPPLPSSKSISIDSLTIGVMDKIILTFDKPWWPEGTQFIGFIWDKNSRAELKDDWVTKIFGVSSPMGSKNSLTVWTSGDGAKLVEVLPEDVVKRKVMELLRRFLGKRFSIPEPTAIIRSTWYSNPYTRGSYTYDRLYIPCLFYRQALAAPLKDTSGAPRVLFAGEATENTHFSTVHGAVDTGFREGMRLITKAKL